MVKKIDPQKKNDFLEKSQEWQAVEGRDAIQKHFQFYDFNTAFAFMTRIAMKAEQMNHHPEWFNVYNRVDVVLTTHDADGVSALDIEMATFMDEISVAM